MVSAWQYDLTTILKQLKQGHRNPINLQFYNFMKDHSASFAANNKNLNYPSQ